jgi:hypothetical protein
MEVRQLILDGIETLKGTARSGDGGRRDIEKVAVADERC